MEKKWTKEEIREKMETSNLWLGNGLKAIFKLQTEDEQHEMLTKHRNNVGFNAADAFFLTSLAEQLIEKGDLTQSQWRHARKGMLKYAGQLARIANGQITGKGE